MSRRYSHTPTGTLLRLAALLPAPFVIGAAMLAHDTRVIAFAGLVIVIVAARCRGKLPFALEKVRGYHGVRFAHRPMR
jgi:hypothetical protein